MTQSLVPPFPSVETQSLRPDPMLDELRSCQPVALVQLPFGGEAWLVTRYDDVKLVQSDDRFSRAKAVGPDVPSTSPVLHRPNSIISMDPPDHTRVRRLVSNAFTVRRIEALRPRARQIVDGLLDEMATAPQPVDVVEHLALPLPIAMICELLGVPFTDRERFRVWADAFLSSSGRTITEIVSARENLLDYLADLVAQRRHEPTDDLLGALVELRDGQDALTEAELVDMALSLLLGGYETTASQIAKSVYCLLVEPDQLAKLRARPELIAGAVEELLRYIPIAAGGSIAWVATEDVELRGVTIRAGDAVIPAIASANRDEAVFEEPDRLDIERATNPHVAFGHGGHYCLGASLARMEMQVAIGSLVARFPGLCLGTRDDEVEWKVGSAIWGLASLPVLLRTTAGGTSRP